MSAAGNHSNSQENSRRSSLADEFGYLNGKFLYNFWAVFWHDFKGPVLLKNYHNNGCKYNTEQNKSKF